MCEQAPDLEGLQVVQPQAPAAAQHACRPAVKCSVRVPEFASMHRTDDSMHPIHLSAIAAPRQYLEAANSVHRYALHDVTARLGAGILCVSVKLERDMDVVWRGPAHLKSSGNTSGAL